MGKILIIVSAVFALLTAVLGFLNKGTLTETRGELADTRSTLESTKTDLAGTKSSLEETNATLEETRATLGKSNAENEKLRADLDGKTSEITKLTADVEAAKSEATGLRAELDESKSRIAALEEEVSKGSGDGTTSDEDPEVKIALLESEKQQLVDEKNSLEQQLASFKKVEEEKAAQTRRNRLLGRILAVNKAWNFVVLSVGDRQGIESNSEMIVRRGTDRIGKVRITSVEPNTSIADIVPSSLSRGLSIQPGDEVLYQIP